MIMMVMNIMFMVVFIFFSFEDVWKSWIFIFNGDVLVFLEVDIENVFW